MSIFEKASRLKFRFTSPQGALHVEDLWDLPLTSKTGKANLDDIARGLHKQLKSGDDVSFVEKSRKSNETVQLQFDLVKYIIDVRLAENEAASKARENSERKQKILAIIASKQDRALEEKSVDELQQLVQAM